MAPKSESLGHVQLKRPAREIARDIITRSQDLELIAISERIRLKGIYGHHYVYDTRGESQSRGWLRSRTVAIQQALVNARGRVAPIAIEKSNRFKPTVHEAQLVLAQDKRLKDLDKELKHIATFVPNLD